MRTDRFDYQLPPERIAQEPEAVRDRALLLVDRGADHAPLHRRVSDLPGHLGTGDLVVVNDTRVRHARLALRKPTGGAAEVLLLRPLGDDRWEALIGANRRVEPGVVLTSDTDATLAVEVLDDLGEGRRMVRIEGLGSDPEARLEAVGALPLPPYITGPVTDDQRYQTIYARHPGSAAAPTAGLHLTPDVLDRIVEAGATVAAVQLDVGLATFRPIATDDVADHTMHIERYRIAPTVWEQVGRARRVVAIGTTTVRALESAAATGVLEGDSSLFITPGFDWQVVEVMMTNFHLPRSSLLVLIEAFVGPRWRDLYAEALHRDYRFLSFGDAMLLERAP